MKNDIQGVISNNPQIKEILFDEFHTRNVDMGNVTADLLEENLIEGKKFYKWPKDQKKHVIPFSTDSQTQIIV